MIYAEPGWTIYNADCIGAGIVDTPADVFFADPPYNYGYNYGAGINDKRTEQGFRQWCNEWLTVAIRRVKPGGAVWLMFPDEWAGWCDYYITSVWGLERRNWIIWHETFGTYQEGKFGRSKRHIIYFVVPGAPFHFNADAVRVESERQRLGDKRANPAGRVPGDVWEIPRLVGNASERSGEVPTQLPEELLTRIIASTCPPRGHVLEFFTGSGSLARVVMLAGGGRTYEGWEKDPRTARVASERIKVVTDARDGLARAHVGAADKLFGLDMSELARDTGAQEGNPGHASGSGKDTDPIE